MIIRTTQETYVLTVGDREYKGWVDQHDNGVWLAYGAGRDAEVFGSYAAAVKYIRAGLIVQAQIDGDNPNRAAVDYQYPITSQSLAVAS